MSKSLTEDLILQRTKAGSLENVKNLNLNWYYDIDKAKLQYFWSNSIQLNIHGPDYNIAYL